VRLVERKLHLQKRVLSIHNPSFLVSLAFLHWALLLCSSLPSSVSWLLIVQRRAGPSTTPM
jgi:hypothetical protein